MKISKVDISDERIGNAEIESLVLKEINGKYLGLFPKNNLLLVPMKKIEFDLKENFKMINKVIVRREFPNALFVDVVPREGVVVWCTGGDCFLVDNSGEVFFRLGPDDEELSNGEMAKVVDTSQKAVVPGEKSVSEKIVQFCLNISGQLRNHLNLEVEKEFETPSVMSDDLRVKTKSGWIIYFNMSEPLETQVEVLKKILAENVKERTNELEYVDLRLKGKVTYKLRQNEEEQKTEGAESENKNDN